ncbi:hypothetical protein BD414DRAFT_484389 [Trametes punicea]|nr:hypothetical protein BD414DRAFT_484389 [Trametes punicea]
MPLLARSSRRAPSRACIIVVSFVVLPCESLSLSSPFLAVPGRRSSSVPSRNADAHVLFSCPPTLLDHLAVAPRSSSQSCITTV